VAETEQTSAEMELNRGRQPDPRGRPQLLPRQSGREARTMGHRSAEETR